MKLKILLFAFVGLLAISCNKRDTNVGISTQPDITLNSLDFEQINKNNYSIKVHKDWVVELYPADEMELYIYLDTSDELVENINLIVRDLGNFGITLNEVIKLAQEEFAGQGRVISSEKIITPSKEYQRMVVTSKYYGEDLRYNQHYILKDSHIYILTFTSLERDFNTYEKVAEQIMQSFTVK